MPGPTTRTMAYPGMVVLPNGSKIFVKDKWDYFRRHPEAYQSTLESVDAVDEARKESKAENERHEKMEVKGNNEVGHNCFGGKVAKSCNCNAT